MNLIIYKAVAALIIFLVSVVTAFYTLKKTSVIKHAESVEIGEAIASGIFLGAAFFHMLPDSIKLFEHLYGTLSFPIPEIICVFAFIFLLFLERLSLTSTKNTIPYLIATILIIHSMIEGAALGIGQTFAEAAMIFIAILAHKSSESFALCVTLLRHQLPMARVLFVIIFFSLMTPLGIGAGTLVNEFTFARHGELAAAIFNAFAAGTFLYISTLHHVHFHKHAKDTQGLLEFACLVLGVMTMGVIAVWS